jgi:chromosome segregation ATPase
MKYYQKVGVALLLIAAFGGITHAQSSTTSDVSTEAGINVKTNPRRLEVQQKAREIRARASSTGEGTDRVCTALNNRIDARLSSFSSRYEDHKTRYDAHKVKLLQISSKLEAAGIATTKLNADIVLLEGKIAKFETDHAKVKAALENTKNYACGGTDGEFKSSVEAIREAQKEVAKDAHDIFQFIKGTLKRDIIELKADYQAHI